MVSEVYSKSPKNDCDNEANASVYVRTTARGPFH